MRKRKLQPFYHNNMVLHVVESHVKHMMKMATDGAFSELKYKAESNDDGWYVVFNYRTNLGKGKVSLKAQEVTIL